MLHIELQLLNLAERSVESEEAPPDSLLERISALAVRRFPAGSFESESESARELLAECEFDSATDSVVSPVRGVDALDVSAPRQALYRFP